MAGTGSDTTLGDVLTVVSAVFYAGYTALLRGLSPAEGGEEEMHRGDQGEGERQGEMEGAREGEIEGDREGETQVSRGSLQKCLGSEGGRQGHLLALAPSAHDAPLSSTPRDPSVPPSPSSSLSLSLSPAASRESLAVQRGVSFSSWLAGQSKQGSSAAGLHSPRLVEVAAAVVTGDGRGGSMSGGSELRASLEGSALAPLTVSTGGATASGVEGAGSSGYDSGGASAGAAGSDDQSVGGAPSHAVVTLAQRVPAVHRMASPAAASGKGQPTRLSHVASASEPEALPTSAPISNPLARGYHGPLSPWQHWFCHAELPFSTALLFGYLGLFNLLIFGPVGLCLHGLAVMRLQWPTPVQWGLVLVKGALCTAWQAPRCILLCSLFCLQSYAASRTDLATKSYWQCYVRVNQ